MRTGILAEFATPEEMLRAIEALQAKGYRRLDAFTPYPVKGLEEALRYSRSPINRVVFPFAIVGAGLAYLLQWWCNGRDYPINVGGRPLHSAPALVPITFEMGVLSASLAGIVLWLVFSGLPELYSPVFDVAGFERASIDRFWVGIDARDPSFDPARIERDLADLGPLSVGHARERAR